MIPSTVATFSGWLYPISKSLLVSKASITCSVASADGGLMVRFTATVRGVLEASEAEMVMMAA